MSDLGWRADGIERALACGGVELELYRRPGFVSGMGVRVSSRDVQVSGYTEVDPEYEVVEVLTQRSKHRAHPHHLPTFRTSVRLLRGGPQ